LEIDWKSGEMGKWKGGGDREIEYWKGGNRKDGKLNNLFYSILPVFQFFIIP